MAKKYKTEHEAFLKMLRVVSAREELEEDWDEALKYNAVWNAITEFASIETDLVDDVPALVREYIDKIIKITQD